MNQFPWAFFTSDKGQPKHKVLFEVAIRGAYEETTIITSLNGLRWIDDSVQWDKTIPSLSLVSWHADEIYATGSDIIVERHTGQSDSELFSGISLAGGCCAPVICLHITNLSNKVPNGVRGVVGIWGGNCITTRKLAEWAGRRSLSGWKTFKSHWTMP